MHLIGYYQKIGTNINSTKQKDMTRHSKVFVPIPVSERLPEKFGMYRCFLNVKEDGLQFRPIGFQQFDTLKNEWTNPSICNKTCEVTHWLEEKENVYVLTEDEIKEFGEHLLEMAEANYGEDAVMHHFNEYIQSKTNPQTQKTNE
jgi:hypothetical protein